MANMNASSEVSDNIEEIYSWIEQITFSRPKRNLARDFSDAVFMAELLKRYYPRYVDVHNYIPGNSISKKLDNWSTLNRKVFAKLDMKLSKDVINHLAHSQPGVIEKVLRELRAKILKDCNKERNSLYSGCGENTKADAIKSLLDNEEMTNKTVPKQLVLKLKQQLQEKSDAITTLHEKVSHLESLMKLKDQRIADLTAQITRSMERDISPRSHILTNFNIHASSV